MEILGRNRAIVNMNFNVRTAVNGVIVSFYGNNGEEVFVFSSIDDAFKFIKERI